MTARRRGRLVERVQAREVVRQRRGRPAQAKLQPADLRDASFDHARLARQVYLSPAEAAAYLRFGTVNALRCWAWRKKIPACRGGRVFLRRDLDDAAQQRREVSANR